MIKLHHHTNTDRMLDLPISYWEFSSATKAIDFIDKFYFGKNIEIVFVCMKEGKDNEKDFFVTDNHLKAQRFFESQTLISQQWFLFEEPTYEEAFEYCKDCAEGHKLAFN